MLEGLEEVYGIEPGTYRKLLDKAKNLNRATKGRDKAVRIKSRGSATTEAAVHYAKQRLSPQEMVRVGLESQLGTDSDIDSLVGMVLGQRPAYRSVEVDCTLEDHEADTELYDLSVKQKFQAAQSEYVVAVCASAELASLISNCCPAVTDVLVGAGESIEEVADSALSAFSVNTVRTSKSGAERYGLAPFGLVEEPERSVVLEGLPEPVRKQVAVFSAHTEETGRGLTRFMSRASLVLPKRGNFCLWAADRPMWVSQISVDISDFTLDGETPKLQFQIFMANSPKVLENRRRTKVAFHVNDWLVAGQGIVFSWRAF